MTDYLVYDVFTDRPFGGNQLAIIPDASAVAEDDLQRIAREFNFSETTFVFPPDSTDHTARVRIFTPTMEVPFAGHPTIGTATALYDMGRGSDLVLELGVGPIRCTVSDDGASFNTAVPLERGAQPDPALMAQCLSLSVDDIAGEPEVASVGLPFAMVPLRDRAALSRARPNINAFEEAAQRYPGKLDFAIYATFREGDTVHARMFAPLDDIFEDPATGSAAAAFAAHAAHKAAGPVALDIRQGDDMGRPSRIDARADADGVTIGGRAVRVMEGRLHV